MKTYKRYNDTLVNPVINVRVKYKNHHIETPSKDLHSKVKFVYILKRSMTS